MVQKFLKTSPGWLRFLLIFPLLCLNGFLLFLVINSIRPLFNYLIIATIIAFLLKLTIKYLVSKGIPNNLAIWGVSLISLLLILFLGITLVPLMITQLANLIDEVPNWIRDTRLQLEQLSQLPLFINLINAGFDVDNWLEQISLAMKNAWSSVGIIVLDLLRGTLNGIFNTLIILILTIFLLLGGKQFWSGIFSWLPAPWNYKVPEYTQESFQEYFTIRLILAAISSVARFVVFLFLGIPFTTLFAFGLGIASLIPFAGAVMALFLTVILSLNSLSIGLKFFISAVIIDQITDNVVAPKLMGGKIGLNPIWILIAIFIGAQVADILGVLVAVPVASVIKRIAEDIRKENKAIKEREQALINQ